MASGCSRLYGAFQLLHPELRRVLLEAGYCKPTPIQERAIPVILRGSHAVIMAPTGSGKTEAAVLPLVSRLLESGERRGIGILYVTPLRSLNRDIFVRLTRLLESAGLRVFVRHGDSTTGERRLFLRGEYDLVVLTPETLEYLLSSSQAFREKLGWLRAVVVDELHELMGSKRGAELAVVLERLQRLSRFRVQRVGVSATISNPRLAAEFLGGGRHVEIIEAPVPKRIEVSVETPKPESSDNELASKLGIEAETVARLRKIIEYSEKYGHILVFTNTRDTAELVAKLLGLLGAEAEVHHGSLSRERRLEVEAAFREGRLPILVATSSLELGIDIGHVAFVVQYLSPRQALKLVQRVGRSGHKLGLTSKGVVLTLRNFYDALESLVLAARAARGDIEDVRPYVNPLDVLAHEIAGIVDERGEVSIEELYEIVTSAWPFQTLDWEEFKRVIETLEYARIVRVRSGVVRRGSRLKSYHYNVTMIPDVKQYTVIEYGTGRKIGVLDEVFVARLEPGSTFVLSGRVWEVVDIGESRVLVKQLQESLLKLPAWEGDLIPVEWRAAREAGALVRRLAEQRDARVYGSYPGSPETWRVIEETLREHIERGYPLPTDKRLVIEVYGNIVAVLGFFGTRCAKALELLLAALVSETLGYTPRTASNAYLVMLELRSRPTREYIENLVKLLARLEWSQVEELIARMLKGSGVYMWKLYHVAVRMGLVEKGAKPDRRFLEALVDTVAGVEALKETIHDKLDLEALKELLSLLRAWSEGSSAFEVAIVYGRSEPSPLLQHAVELASSGDRVKSETVPASVLAEVHKARLDSRRVRLVCLNCGHVFEERLGALDDRPKCPKCGAALLAPTRLESSEVRRLVEARRRRVKLKGEDARRLRELMEAANLVLTYGKYAVYALETRGVGPATAKRILGALAYGEEKFFEELVKAEQRFLKTRAYWS